MAAATSTVAVTPNSSVAPTAENAAPRIKPSKDFLWGTLLNKLLLGMFKKPVLLNNIRCPNCMWRCNTVFLVPFTRKLLECGLWQIGGIVSLRSVSLAQGMIFLRQAMPHAQVVQLSQLALKRSYFLMDANSQILIFTSHWILLLCFSYTEKDLSLISEILFYILSHKCFSYFRHPSLFFQSYKRILLDWLLFKFFVMKFRWLDTAISAKLELGNWWSILNVLGLRNWAYTSKFLVGWCLFFLAIKSF